MSTAPTTRPKPTRSADHTASASASATATDLAPPTVGDADIYERIVSAILNHQLPPGTKLVEDKLATAFGVSRTRIRPVLVRLANEQVVTLTPNRGASIAQPTEKEAREVFEVRRLIEPTLVTLFIAKATNADIDSLSRCINDEETARTNGDMRRAIRLAGDFHLRIADVAGHDTLGRIMRELTSRTTLILMTYSSAHANARLEATVCGCREHRTLLDAIRLRDPVEATRRMHDHLTRLETQLEFHGPADAAPDLSRLFGTEA